MSLLTIANAVFNEVQLDEETAIVGADVESTRRLLRYANSVGSQLALDINWQILRREHSFTAIAGETQTGILPSDFGRFIPEAFYDRTNKVLVNGPIGPQQWQALKSSDVESSERRNFIYRADSIIAYPAFSGGESLAFEYVSAHWCESSGGTGQSAFAADTDVARLDEELLTLAIAVAWLAADGLTIGHMMHRYDKRLAQLTKQDQPKRHILPAGDVFASGRHWDGQPPSQGGYSRINGWI